MHTASASCAQTSRLICSHPVSQSLSRRGRTARKHERLQARSAVATAEPPVAAKEGTLDLRTASSLLLAYESFRRATGRPMVSCKDLLEVPDKLHGMPCCLVLVHLPSPPRPSFEATAPSTPTATAPSTPTTTAQAQPHTTHAHSTAAATQQAAAQQAMIAYANVPAQQLLLGSEARTQGLTNGSEGSENGQGPLSSSSSSSSSTLGCEGTPLVGLLCDGQALQPALQACELQPGQNPRCWWHRGLQWALPQRECRGRILTTDCLLLDVASPSGKVSLRALLFDKWRIEDGRIGRPFLPALLPSEVPTVGDLAAAEDAVRAQADAVRALKVQEGLSNQDPRVVASVADLQALKHKTSSLQAALLAFSDAQSHDDLGVSSPYCVLEGL